MKKILFLVIATFTFVTLNVNAETFYDVYVDDVRLSDVNSSIDVGGGTVSYDNSTKELTLNGITLNANNYAINLTNTTDEVKIIVKGNNTITALGSLFGIRSSNKVIITGDGKLTINSGWASIQGKQVIIDGANVDLTTTETGQSAIENENGLIIKNGAKVKAKGNGSSISSYSKMTISDSELDLEATADNSNAIFVNGNYGDGSLTITDSKIKAKSGYATIYSLGNMKITGSNLDLVGNAGGIWSDSSLSLKNDNVKINSQNYGIGVNQNSEFIIDNCNLDITTSNVSFVRDPQIINLGGKVILAGNDADLSYDDLAGPNDIVSRYKYVKTVNVYTVKVIADSNVLGNISSSETVVEGSNKEIIVKIKDGYRLKSVLVNESSKKLTNDKVLLNNINKDIVVKISTEVIPTKVENPDTADNILISFATLFISVIGMSSCFVLKKRFN